MQPGKTLRARLGWSPVAAVLVAWLLGPPSALGQVSRQGAGDLSPRLAELAKPAVRSLAPGAQAQALSLAKEGPGSLLREGGRVLAEVRFGAGAGNVGALRQAGAEIASRSPRYKTVTVAVKPADLQAIAAVRGVASVSEVLTPLTFAAAGCPSGATVSEGDLQLRAAEARTQFGVDGSGVTVGILSDSFDRETTAATHATEDVLTGDLPGLENPCGHLFPVNKLDDSEAEGADEGRAMTQIVHDLAPGAKLAFATAFISETGFAKNIERLAAPVAQGGAGARVIADDVAWFEEPFFQDGPIAVAASKVSASGVDYLSAAGNDNLIDAEGHDIASWEAPQFRDSLSCPPVLTVIPGLGATHCMDFDPEEGVGHTDNTFRISVEEGATLTLDLQWAEPWYGVKTDLDAFLLDAAGNPIKVAGHRVESAQDNVGQTEKPVEIIQWENTGSAQEVQLAINRCSSICNQAASASATPRLKVELLENGRGVTSTEYPVSSGGDRIGPTIFGHAGANAVLSVGAVRFNSNSAPQTYSSRGPVAHYFGPVSGTSPAPQLASEELISKPDIVATDCGVTTFFAFNSGGKWRFCGTSAAAPHAAAVAALMLQRNHLLSPSAVRSVLTSTASPVGAYGVAAVGAGLVNASAALGAIEPAPAEAGELSSQVVQEPVPDATTAPTNLTTPESSPSPPLVFFTRHPRRVVRTARRTARATFRLGSNESGATFICSVDKHAFRGCGRTLSRRFAIGSHAVRAVARGSSGSISRTPAIYRFRVKLVRR